jgi:CDP-diacylglycerol--glycerol-3-phosphate 3-phosphatidyltransferase
MSVTEKPASDPTRPDLGEAHTTRPRGGGSGVPGSDTRAAGTAVDPLSQEPSGAGVLNLANLLTVARLLLVPVVAVALLHAHASGGTSYRAWAFAAFAVACVTDRLDGEVARRRGLVTDFGKVADPIADKALTGTALVVLSVLGDLPWWLTSVILVRELGVTGLRFWVIRRGVIAASRGGKLKTLLQAVAIGLYILPLDGVWGHVRWWFMAAALVVTLGTGVDYVLRAIRLHRTGRSSAVVGPRPAPVRHPAPHEAIAPAAASDDESSQVAG